MTAFRVVTLVFLMCITIDLHDPTMPGVFFVEHDHLFVDAVTRSDGTADAAERLAGDLRSRAVPARLDLPGLAEVVARRPAPRHVRRRPWPPGARRAPSRVLVPPDPEAAA